MRLHDRLTIAGAPGHSTADQRRPQTPNVEVGGYQATSRMRLRPCSLSACGGLDWKQAQSKCQR